jgi:hypothetical protein
MWCLNKVVSSCCCLLRRKNGTLIRAALAAGPVIFDDPFNWTMESDYEYTPKPDDNSSYQSPADEWMRDRTAKKRVHSLSSSWF